jgi:hypothetical protein
LTVTSTRRLRGDDPHRRVRVEGVFDELDLFGVGGVHVRDI